MKKYVILSLLHLLILNSQLVGDQDNFIESKDAKNYVGQIKTVCGKVASTKYANSSKGQPTFLNIDKPYPNHIFTVLIWGSNRHKFSNPPEDYYKNKSICVSGLIESYKDIAEIIVDDPVQIESKP